MSDRSTCGGQSRAIVVLARAPSVEGKTRLTAGLDEKRACALRNALLLDTLDRARATGAALIVCYTPDDAGPEIARLAPDAALCAQRGVDLGARMASAMDAAFDNGVRQVAIIGSDLPTLPPDFIDDAFAMLDAGADVVFGPADDGGFYLMASGAPLPPILGGIEWGTSSVLSEVVKAADGAGLIVGLARTWWDVDDPADLDRVRRLSPASRVATIT